MFIRAEDGVVYNSDFIVKYSVVERPNSWNVEVQFSVAVNHMRTSRFTPDINEVAVLATRDTEGEARSLLNRIFKSNGKNVDLTALTERNEDDAPSTSGAVMFPGT